MQTSISLRLVFVDSHSRPSCKLKLNFLCLTRKRLKLGAFLFLLVDYHVLFVHAHDALCAHYAHDAHDAHDAPCDLLSEFQLMNEPMSRSKCVLKFGQ